MLVSCKSEDKMSIGFEKSLLSKESKPTCQPFGSSKVALVKPLPLNAEFPILVKLDGKVIVVRLSQP